jgi:hypothetical protein
LQKLKFRVDGIFEGLGLEPQELRGGIFARVGENGGNGVGMA